MTEKLHNGDTFEHCGIKFVVHVKADDRNEAPWENEDGHGPVRVLCHALDGNKRPGERVLWQDGRTRWLYDWQAAIATAKQDGWDAEPIGQGTPGERAARAVQADFDRLRAWLRGDWWYVGVCVRRADDNTPNALWGIESDSPEYHAEVARELADEIAESMKNG